MFSPLWAKPKRLRSVLRTSGRRSFASPWLRLHLEQLEDRRLMNADDPAAAAEGLAAEDAAVDVAETSADPAPVTSSVSALPERFQSAAELEAWLLEAAVAQWGHLFGQSTYYPQWDWGRVFTTDAMLFGGPLVPMVTTAAVNSFSDTNVQVEGVDEADLVETDGEYLYILSGQDLVIVEAGVGEELQVVSRTRLAERPVGMYLAGDRLALVSSSPGGFGEIEPIRMMPMIAIARFSDMPQDSESTGPTTTVTVLDVTDRSAPTLVQKTEMDGQLVTSRVVDGQLRLVLTNSLQLPAPIAMPVATVLPAPIDRTHFIRTGEPVNLVIADSLWPGPTGQQYVYETQEQYLARFRDELLDTVLPHTRALALDGEVISDAALFEPTDLYQPDSFAEQSVITVATFDLTSNEAGAVATSNVMSSHAPQVYSTADSLYVFAQQHPDWSTWDSSSVNKSNVWKFGLDSQTHAVTLGATGEFEGTLLNQFAADERDGYLRVVTKPGGWNTGHSVHVLEQSEDALTVIGTIGGIAPSEDLYSVRFMEDRAFFVTFRRTDPLFAIDLSEPASPQLLGELHIPGFSDYLQPIDDNHLLAIGRDADVATGWFEELQVSIFDVSDLTDPQLLHRYSFAGGRSTATPATGSRGVRGDGDHHAVSYFDAEQIFALPINTVGNDWWWDPTEDTPLFEPGEGGLQVFKIDLEDGFTPIGLVEHDTLVERSVQIGDHLYAISTGTISVHELADPQVQLGKISIAGDPEEQPLDLKPYQPPERALASTTNVTSLDEEKTDPPSTDDPQILAVSALDDNFTVNAFGDAQFLAVRDNDTHTDPQGQLRVTAVSSTALGATVSISPNGLGVLYMPTGMHGVQDTFTYTLSDGAGNDDTATVTVDLINDPIQVTLFSRQLVVPGEISTTVLRWHDPDPFVAFSASLTWSDNTPAPLHLTQTFSPEGTDATLSFWRTPTTFGEFTGTLTVQHSGGYTASYLVSITSVTVILRPDHADATKTELAIGGFNLNDPILFQPDVGGKKMVSPNVVETVPGEASARLFYHGSDMGTFIADRIVVYGQGGNDLIQVNEAIAIDAWLFGGAGNDILVGGAGHDILVGGTGDDILYGFNGRDLLFGGLGRDYLQGPGWSGTAAGDDSDILVGGYVSFDFDQALLSQLAEQWRTSLPYETRVSTVLAGPPSLRLNETVFDDFSPDLLDGPGQFDLFIES
ncbi:MAG: beta-propeller domain-containing protein [Pirellulales bacterium]